MKEKKRTKILATLGPSSSNEEVLRAMVDAGLDAVRINTSHTELGDVEELVRLVRNIAESAGHHIAVVFDLAGPKIRIENVPGGGVDLSSGDAVVIAVNPEDTELPAEASIEPPVITSDYATLPSELSVDEKLLIGDGEVHLVVERVEMDRVFCRVISGGHIAKRKGITRPGRSFAAESLQPRDYEFIRIGCELEIDWFAVSFVRQRNDLEHARGAVLGQGGKIPLIAKIEQPEAIENLEDVLGAADGVMVARGDLGLFLPVEEVPMIQKRIIARAREYAIPVITATQMLESMVENDFPTRAEVSDVANAILDGTDALMLSGETAVGAYPVQTVEMMTRVSLATEPSLHGTETWAHDSAPGHDSVAEHVAISTCNIARHLTACAIVAPTSSGFSARNVTRYRPGCPVIAPTRNLATARRLALSFGVVPVLVDEILDLKESLSLYIENLKGMQSFEPGDYLVFIGGVPARRSGITNFIKVEQVPTSPAKSVLEGD